MQIRRATMDDMPDLLRLEKEIHYAKNLKRFSRYEDAVPGITECLATHIASPNCLVQVAEKEGRLVAFQVSQIAPMYWDPTVRVAMQLVIWVNPEHVGGGIGKGLMDGYEQWARDSGVKHIMAGVAMNLSPKKLGKVLIERGYQVYEKTYLKDAV